MDFVLPQVLQEVRVVFLAETFITITIAIAIAVTVKEAKTEAAVVEAVDTEAGYYQEVGYYQGRLSRREGRREDYYHRRGQEEDHRRREDYHRLDHPRRPQRPQGVDRA